jgi:SAM-dependent methyltransferase
MGVLPLSVFPVLPGGRLSPGRNEIRQGPYLFVSSQGGKAPRGLISRSVGIQRFFLRANGQQIRPDEVLRPGHVMSPERPFSESCERNKDPILAVLRHVFERPGTVLEIGSGTGQHAVHFARAMPEWVWQTSDLPVHHPGILAWQEEAGLPNLPPPLSLDVGGPWPATQFDYAFTANTLHIMSWTEVVLFFACVSRVLKPEARLAVYGPFNYGGQYTSESNARFDEWLKARNPHSAIRNFESVNNLAQSAGFTLLADLPMPANNRTVVWEMN